MLLQILLDEPRAPIYEQSVWKKYPYTICLTAAWRVWNKYLDNMFDSVEVKWFCTRKWSLKPRELLLSTLFYVIATAFTKRKYARDGKVQGVGCCK